MRSEMSNRITGLAAERLEALRKVLRQRGVMRVDELAAELGVSSATVRRDLAELHKRGYLRRVHGGAVSEEGRLDEVVFDDEVVLWATSQEDAVGNKACPTKASAPVLTRRRFLSCVAAGTAGMAWHASGTPPAFAQQRTFAARFGCVAAAANAEAIADKFFCDEANKRSGGALQIQFFPDSQIGASRDLLEGVQLGTVQFCSVSTANITPFLADTMVFDLPYVFTSQPALLKFLDGPEGSEKLAVERFATIKMRALGWYDTGSRKIYNSRKPIHTPDDLKGMKIRVEENPVRVASLNAMGAQATPMAFSEIYGALQQRVVDGAENSEQSYMSSKHFEVAPFFSITDHFMTPNLIVVGTLFFNSLPKELQDLLIQVGKDAAALERRLWAENGAKVIGEMKAAGVKINDADKKAFQAMVTKVHQDFAKRVPKEWWDTVMKAAGL